MRIIVPALCLLVSPAAAQSISFPVAVPQECSQLAMREHVPLLIESKYQATVARLKLARLSISDPLVAQCKDAVSRLVAAKVD